ncbi:DUF948 domain-containing protein [Pseudalkalibacillus salsuginis]|uniref:DUF948 domain-containing protein n=1 Tax=Pseudalkalibacillus salsuginis TaxID=2910972 RepID=UPI001F48FD13|nr:DUF948 domain-containing protein [Pseudalkalibacillus salsuginis]MCF6408161.1 DUF948 domain-containing protein [Pseudalkalibacillus salsuginis]
MDLVGIGVLIIGLAFVVLTIFLARVLHNLTDVIKGVNHTVQQLPGQLDKVTKQTGELIDTSKDTLVDVNEKLRALSPLFYIVGDIGETTRKLSSSLVDVTNTVKKNTSEGTEITRKRDLSGLYGAISLGYYWKQKHNTKKTLQQEY